MQAGTVIGRATDRNGNPIVAYNSISILNTRIYEVMFPGGSVQKFEANIITENMYSQVDEDKHRYMLLDEIIDH